MNAAASRGGVRRDTLIPAALDYASRGWRVFPLRPDDKRPAFPDHPETHCDPARSRDPRCRRAGRHVAWQERATTDPERIRRAWQTLTPAGPYGIGIACGPSNLVVLDLDTPKPGEAGGSGRPPAEWAEPGIYEGADVLAALCTRHGQPFPLGSTYTVRTGRGGLHLYFTQPAIGDVRLRLRCTAGQLGWLIDTRADGGYVVAPPSTAAGARYTLDLDALTAPLPDWIADALTPAPLPPQEPVQARLRGPGPHTGGERLNAYLAAAMTRQLDTITHAGPGGRNRALYVSAIALGQLVAGGELARFHAIGMLRSTALAAGLRPTETTRTIESGLKAGARRPRTITQPSHRTDPNGAAA